LAASSAHAFPNHIREHRKHIEKTDLESDLCARKFNSVLSSPSNLASASRRLARGLTRVESALPKLPKHHFASAIESTQKSSELRNAQQLHPYQSSTYNPYKIRVPPPQQNQDFRKTSPRPIPQTARNHFIKKELQENSPARCGPL
jgi:hypothetical protein